MKTRVEIYCYAHGVVAESNLDDAERVAQDHKDVYQCDAGYTVTHLAISQLAMISEIIQKGSKIE